MPTVLSLYSFWSRREPRRQNVEVHIAQCDHHICSSEQGHGGALSSRSRRRTQLFSSIEAARQRSGVAVHGLHTGNKPTFMTTEPESDAGTSGLFTRTARRHESFQRVLRFNQIRRNVLNKADQAHATSPNEHGCLLDARLAASHHALGTGCESALEAEINHESRMNSACRTPMKHESV